MTRCRVRLVGSDACSGYDGLWLNWDSERADKVGMNARSTNDPRETDVTPIADGIEEAKPDPLAAIAVDANALADAIGSGHGTDFCRLVEDLLRDRPAA